MRSLRIAATKVKPAGSHNSREIQTAAIRAMKTLEADRAFAQVNHIGGTELRSWSFEAIAPDRVIINYRTLPRMVRIA